MFALASDLLRYVRVDVQGPHLLIPDRSVQSRSAPRRLAGPAMALGSGLDLHRWRAAVGPLASTAGIDVTAGHLPVGGGTGERLDPDDIGVPRVGGRTSRRRGSRETLGRWIRIRFTVRHLLGRSLRGRADGSLPSSEQVLRGRSAHAPGMGVKPKVPAWAASSAAGHGYPTALRGRRSYRVDAHRAAVAKIAVTRFKISTSSRSLRFSRRSSASSRRSALVSPSLRVPASRPA